MHPLQVPVRPEFAELDLKKLTEVYQRPCRCCGHPHRGMLMMEDGTLRCARCAHVYAKPKLVARPATTLRLPASRRRLQTRPTSSPRPRAPRARVVVAAGRDGGQERDDGGGGDGDGDGGGGEPPSPARETLRQAVEILGSAEKLAGILGYSRHALNRSLKTGSVSRRMAAILASLLSGGVR